jgi:hypothetical protein
MSKVGLGDFNYFLPKVLRCETLASQFTSLQIWKKFLNNQSPCTPVILEVTSQY